MNCHILMENMYKYKALVMHIILHIAATIYTILCRSSVLNGSVDCTLELQLSHM